METAKLRKFAQFARRSLIEQVGAKLKLVLAEESPARRESPLAIKKLEEAGYIKQRVALLDQDLLNLGMTAYVMIKTSHHDDSWLARFSEGVSLIPEVIEIHRMAGDIDYLLKIVATDMSDYDRIYKRLITVAELFDVSASFSMERIKSSTELPLDRT